MKSNPHPNDGRPARITSAEDASDIISSHLDDESNPFAMASVLPSRQGTAKPSFAQKKVVSRSTILTPTVTAPGVPLNELLSKLDAPGGASGFQFHPYPQNNLALPTPPPSSPKSASSSCVLPPIYPSDIYIKGGVPGDDGEMVPVHDVVVNDLLVQEIARREAEMREAAFYVGDLSVVYAAVQQWLASPLGGRVEIFYAVKCNPSPAVVHLLSLMGTSFDCASVAEIDIVMNSPNRPSPDRIIFANPCKPASFIRSAQRSGVEMMTFDNADELYKIARNHPSAKLVLRMLTDDSKSLCRLGLKYGAPLSTCPGLISLARSLGLNIIGVSFHVGSGCKDPNQFADAVWRAKRVFEMGKKEGYTFSLLDVGGGFEQEGFELTSRVLAESLEEHFPAKEGVRLIAEPGRLLVSTAFTLATSIIARRKALPVVESGPSDLEEGAADVAEEEASTDVMYYCSEGVYGALNGKIYDHQVPHCYPLTLGGSATAALPRPPGPPPPNVYLPVDLTVTMGYAPANLERASLWGPTCDSIDCIRESILLPKDLEVGDVLGFCNVGAYSLCAASTFNGMEVSKVVWTTGGEDDEYGRGVRMLLEGFTQ